MLRALAIAFAVVAMTCGSTTASADVRAGVYSLRATPAKVTIKPTGEAPAPSCGRAAKHTLNAYRAVIVQYGRTARVNRIEWTIVARGADLELVHKEPPLGALLMLVVHESPANDVRGHLLYYRPDKAGDMICADSVGLRGLAVDSP